MNNNVMLLTFALVVLFPTFSMADTLCLFTSIVIAGIASQIFNLFFSALGLADVFYKGPDSKYF